MFASGRSKCLFLQLVCVICMLGVWYNAFEMYPGRFLGQFRQHNTNNIKLRSSLFTRCRTRSETTNFGPYPILRSTAPSDEIRCSDTATQRTSNSTESASPPTPRIVNKKNVVSSSKQTCKSAREPILAPLTPAATLFPKKTGPIRRANVLWRL